jgi:hypothetical protein
VLVVSRRAFLKGSLFLLGGGVLAACGPSQEENPMEAAGWITPTPAQVLPSPIPSTEVPAAQDLEGLEEFMVLSAVLTGVSSLNPQLGRAYLQSLRGNPDFSGGLPGFFERTGVLTGAVPENVDDLAQKGIFDDEGLRRVADKIIELWYTGIAEVNGESTVITYVDALAFKVLHFTKPLTICGRYGFWAEEPNVNL